MTPKNLVPAETLYQVSVKLHLLECYPAMTSEVIPEEDWLILYLSGYKTGFPFL